MVEVASIPEVIVANPPASAEAVAAADRLLPAAMPEEYAALLAQAAGVIANRFVLYSCHELPERNATFQVSEYAPGFVAIGDDNGGMAIVLQGGPGRSPVFVVGHGTMQRADMVQVAGSLVEWIGAGCPVDPDA